MPARWIGCLGYAKLASFGRRLLSSSTGDRCCLLLLLLLVTLLTVLLLACQTMLTLRVVATTRVDRLSITARTMDGRLTSSRLDGWSRVGKAGRMPLDGRDRVEGGLERRRHPLQPGSSSSSGWAAWSRMTSLLRDRNTQYMMTSLKQLSVGSNFWSQLTGGHDRPLKQ